MFPLLSISLARRTLESRLLLMSEYRINCPLEARTVRSKYFAEFQGRVNPIFGGGDRDQATSFTQRQQKVFGPKVTIEIYITKRAGHTWEPFTNVADGMPGKWIGNSPTCAESFTSHLGIKFEHRSLSLRYIVRQANLCWTPSRNQRRDPHNVPNDTLLRSMVIWILPPTRPISMETFTKIAGVKVSENEVCDTACESMWPK